MLRTLHARLAAVLLALLLTVGSVQVILTLRTTELHLQEVGQSLQLDLAEHLTAAKHTTFLTAEGEIRAAGLQELFHWLMVVNPGVEFYLLDMDGRIRAYDDTPGKVTRQQVAMAPIEHFLDPRHRLPILGDDPRHPNRRKIFSVAPIPPPETGATAGYLYIVLASEQYDSATELLRSSYVLRLASWTLLASIALAAAAGLLLFRRLTQPLRQLASRIRAFGREGAGLDLAPADDSDEVLLLDASFGRMTERILRQIEDMQRLEDERRELVANISHDLRTPIASLQGYLDTLVLKNDQLSDTERDEYQTIAWRQSERLGRLVEELFELTKLDHQQIAPSLEAFSINELVQDNVQRYHLQAAERGVELKAVLNPELPPVVADIGLLERVLENLLENALRFTPPEGSITIELLRRSEDILVRIRDTGCGIAEEDLPHVFERFYKSRDQTRGHQGAGLGLAITQRILELHNSRIEVESVEGQGTVFAFPLALAGT